MKRTTVILGFALIVLLTMTAGLACGPKPPGVLEGKASIGPRPESEAGQPYPADVYQPRKVMVYSADRSTLISQVSLDDQGYYHVELAPGTYTIDINYVGTDRSNAAPRKLSIESGLHYMFDIDFNTGALLNVVPGAGGKLLDSQGQPTDITLEYVHVDQVFADRQYFSPWYPEHTVEAGQFIIELKGSLKNDGSLPEIAMYAEGYDEAGNQTAWTLDESHIAGQIGLRVETGQSGKFTLHLNYSQSTRVIRLTANAYAVTPP